MQYPVRVELFKDGLYYKKFIAQSEADLNCRIEMMTGIAWLDTTPLYQALLVTGRDHVTDIYPVCHSYEQWGGLQQEVVRIKVQMYRLDRAKFPVNDGHNDSMTSFSQNKTAQDREDLREEWYLEWYLYYSAYAGWIPKPPPIYWIGMALSAIWLAAYLVIYPSIPTLKSHWQGTGMPGHCQPWTAICEMQKAEEELNDARGKYFNKIRAVSVVELAESSEMSDFISKAGRVRFEDNCAACHGKSGAGIADMPDSPALNDNIWLHGGDVRSIRASIQNPTVHPFGLAQRIDDTSAKMLAVYVSQLGH